MKVAEGLLRDGQYHRRLDHISNGQLSPELGGPQDHWENQLFVDVYRYSNLSLNSGALDLHVAGRPRRVFGNCYLLTHRQRRGWQNLCYLDSYRNPKRRARYHVSMMC